MFVCGVFVDLQKIFDTVDHNILLHKRSHYGIIDIANCWFLPTSQEEICNNKWI